MITTNNDAVKVLTCIDESLDRLITQGIQNAFIVAGSHNDLMSVIEYLKSQSTPASTPKTEKE